MKRPVGIREMGSRQTYQICSPSCDDTVDMIYFIDIANGYSGYVALVTDEIRQRGLKHPARLWLCLVRRLPGGDVDDVSPGI